MAANEFPLTLVIRALDKATGPLRAMTARLNTITAPFRGFAKEWGKFSEAAGLSKIGAGFRGVGSSIQNVGREAFALGARMFGLAAAGTFAAYTIVKGAVEAGDKLGEMSARVGTTVDFFASLQHAAAQADVDQESFNSSLDQFNKRLGQMRAGGGPLLAYLNKISPAFARQVKGAKSTEAALSLITDAMHRHKNVSDRAALSDAAFGKSGKAMAGFFGQGSAAIQEQQAAFMRLAGSQEAFAKNAGDLDNAMRETEVAFLGLRSAALGALFPAFTKLAKGLSDFIVKNRDGLQKWAETTGAAIQAWVDSGGIDRLVESLKSFAGTVGKVVDMIGGLKGVAAAAAVIMSGPLLGAVLSLVPAAWSLLAAFAPIGAALFPFFLAASPFLAAAAGVAAAGAAIYENWAEIKNLFNDLWLEIRVAFLNGWAGIEPIVQKLLGAAGIVSQITSNPVGFAANAIFGPAPAPALGAASARPRAGSNETRVKVAFSNVPPGVSVTPQSGGTAPLDLSVGRTMVPQ